MGKYFPISGASAPISTKLLISTTALCILISFISGAQSQSSSCYIFGTQHVYTFDGQIIDFSTDLELLAAETYPPSIAVPAQFSISLDNEYKYTNIDSASQVKCVKVIYKSYVSKICADQTAFVNGDEVVDSILLSNSQLMIYYGTAGRELAIQVMDTVIRVTITSASSVTISLPDSYKSTLRGLCGNFDDNSADDLSLLDKTLITPTLSQSVYQTGALIATSNAGGAGNVTEFVPSYCSGDPDELTTLTSPDLCGSYDGSGTPDVFSTCRTNAPELTQTFKDLCVYDYCENYLSQGSSDETVSACAIDGTCVRNETLAKEAVNAIAEVYTDICKSQGFGADSNWRSDYSADVTCSSGTYTADGPLCPNVCGLASDRCTETGVEGCECPSGQWKEGNVCVDSTTCGCSDTNTGEYYSIGQTWIDNLCTTLYSCSGANTIDASALMCSENSICNSEGCICASGYVGDGETCELSCDAGSEPLGTPEQCTECPVGSYKDSVGTAACVACPGGQITDLTGSTALSDCKDITMAPESSSADVYTDVADESFLVTVPPGVLPNGLPFGNEKYRNIWVSTNGIISFGESFVGRTPSNPENLEAPAPPTLAPFWVRQDLRIPAGIPTPTNDASELTISSFNTLDQNQASQEEAANSLNQIKILLDASEQFRALGSEFNPNYAIVVNWKNTSPNPAVFYAMRESMYYQTVIVTNGIRTYAIFIYPSGGIILNQFFRRSIYMGFQAQDGGLHEYNYYKSNTPGVTALDTDPSNTDENGRWVFEVSNFGADNQAAKACLQWYNIQKFYMFPTGIMEDLGIPCPCNVASASIDENFFFDYNSYCSFSLYRKPTTGFVQQCCYEMTSGSLILDPEDGGYPVLYHPFLTYNIYEAFDLTPYTQCCQGSQYCDLYREFRPVDTCDQYIAPTISCGFGDPHIYTLDGQLYTYNPLGEFWMIMSDQFSMQSRMIQALGQDMELVPATQFGAFAMKSLPPLNSSTVHVEINNNRTDFEVRVNGESIQGRLDTATQTTDDLVLSYDDGALVLKKFNGSISVSFQSGFSFRFSLRLNILSIQSFIPDSAKGTIDGLLGHFDGDAENDLMDRNGNIVCVLGYDNCTVETIHYDFGETWRLTDDESLFWYRPGWSTDTFTDASFKPIFSLPQNQTLSDECSNDFQCIFDTFMTNSSEVGLDTRLTLREVEDKAVTLGTTAPSVIGLTRFNASVNTLFSAVYSVNYTGNYSVTIEAINKPTDATFVYDDGSDSYVFEWTPADLQSHSIQLVARETDRIDGENAVSPIFDVSVRLSPECVNGVPNFDTLASNGQLSSLFSIVECACEPGWTGTLCDVDYDGCVDSPCVIGGCMDVPAAEFDVLTGITYACNITNCTTGYERLEINGVPEAECTDINECLDNTTCTKADCSNSDGSFACTCNNGYGFALGSETVCENIDECTTGVDKCEQLCTDNEGSYECGCNSGYSLNDDFCTCTADNATALACQLANCSFACINDEVSGDVNCTCPRGQRLNADGRSCDLIDECAENLDVCVTDTGATCHDLPIGYECRCPEMGYHAITFNYEPCRVCDYGLYGMNCNETCMCGDRARSCNNTDGCVDCATGWQGEQCATDRNECDDPDACGPSANCTNTPGSYYCQCPDGYVNQNFTHCEDINECQTNNPCSKLATCNNTAGSYSCDCLDGYTGSGIQCSDINECSPLDGSAGPCVIDLATCKNEIGSFSCICEQGYHGNGKADSTGCKNDNECIQASNVCGGMNNECVDTEGSYVCRCLDGYSGDGVICDNVDECTDNTFNCTTYDVVNGFGACKDNNGSYSCSTECNEGYNMTILNSGEITCVPIDECSIPTTCDAVTETCVDTPGSFRCDCVEGYIKDNETCINIDECANGTDDCVDPLNGVSNCVDTVGSFTCSVACNTGYESSVSAGVTSCVDIDECSLGECDAITEDCSNTVGSYSCACKDGYADNAGTCEDINECLNADACGEDGTRICVNLPADYDCTCHYGYEGDTCDAKTANAEFISVEQVFTLTFQEEWADTSSSDFIVLESLLSQALAVLFSSNTEFLGVNVISVSLYEANTTDSNSRKKRQATTDTGTTVNYDAVFSSDVDNADVIHVALDYLVTNGYKIDFNDTQIADKLMIAYPGVFTNGAVTCDTTITIDGKETSVINCQGKGTCDDKSETDYPMCVCDKQYEGYNCGSESGVAVTPEGNLLALWISVAVAGALLLGGLLACTMVLVYQRRQRSPPLHRYPRAFSTSTRGPALFNPTSRMPAEAYNYQFPVGSVRDDLSDASSTISRATTRTQHTEGRVGSTVPFAPRWPRAYYAQLGDPDDQ